MRGFSNRGAAPPLAQALSSLEFLPIAFDPENRSLALLQTSRQEIRRSAFLVPSLMGPGQRLFRVNLDDLMIADVLGARKQVVAHYIFICASCCSTLLARYLDSIPGCLVLREPGFLAQLARLRCQGAPRRRSTGAWDEADWLEWAAACASMLARLGERDRFVIVKGTDLCNAMIGEIMAQNERSKAVLLSVDLRTFVLSMLKSEGRRVWMRGRVRLWRRYLSGVRELAHLKPSNDAQGAAYLWLATHWLWRSPVIGPAPGRFMLLDGRTVSERPQEALAAVNTHFSLGLEYDDLNRICDTGMSRKHSKYSAQKYDSTARQRDLAQWDARFGSGADRAMAWLSDNADVAGIAPGPDGRY